MSRERGLAAIHLQPTEKIPHTQYISHDEFIREVTGLDTTKQHGGLEVLLALARALDYDFVFKSCEMPLTQGRITRMGHAAWSDINPQDNQVECPFESPDDVLDFSPVDEYGIPPHKEIVSYFKSHLKKMRAGAPDTVIPGARYNTLFSACIRSFGWEMFLSSVPQDYKRFDRVLEGFFQITKAEIEAWLETDIEVYLTHDDITWTAGAVFHPDWYREYIFPRYKRLWQPLKDAGIPVLYCSDGDYSQFIDDIAEAGADGFFLEPCVPLEYLVEHYGKTKSFFGNVDCRALQFGTKEDIECEVRRCIELAKGCPGYFMAVGNHIPNGIPLEHVHYYFEIFEKLRYRT